MKKEEIEDLAKRLREAKIDTEPGDIKHQMLLIGGKIKAYRVLYKLTQEELAKKLGVPKLQIIRWEGCKNMPNTLAITMLKEKGII